MLLSAAHHGLVSQVMVGCWLDDDPLRCEKGAAELFHTVSPPDEAVEEYA